ncbi:MAG: EFR1 family ferrodoxin [Endomicrobiales bacterium]|nr:EFR1 family ferrodoxin [Endomicrobiales bacterium]
MKTIIYYFSGTGNSLKVAKDVAEELGNTEVLPIAKALKGQVRTDADAIGVVYPVYMWGLPLMVAEFLKRFENTGNKYFFCVATFGGDPGAANLQVSRILAEKGIKLSSGFGVKMPGNYIPLYGAYSQAKQDAMFRKGKEKAKIIADTVKEKKEQKIEQGNWFMNSILSKFLYPVSAPRIPMMDEKFRVKPECNSCGICFKVCPASNIKLEAGKPVWQHKCQQCMACIQLCPVYAIEYGNNTEGRKRYRNPAVRVDELFVN